MNLENITQNNYFRLACFGLIFILACYVAHVNESVISKAKRVNFPGNTVVLLNKTTQHLNLKKVDSDPHPELVAELTARNLKLVSHVYFDQASQLTVAVTQSSLDKMFVFAVLRNNQLIQIQKINEITNQQISLQYGKITLNAPATTAQGDGPIAL